MGKGFDLSQYIQPGKLNVSESNTNRREVVMIPARKVFANDMNFYDVSNVSDLIDSILIHGLLEPVVVRPSGDGEGYIIISGHRRHKAWMTILDDNLSDNPEHFLEIPCFVTDPKDELIEELMLIQANSATRVLTSAEISKQVERAEDLIYRLKEQGFEFPGRMRDHVAALCNVSATKLAKLKVIREGLCPEYAGQFEEGALSEQAAYALARLPVEFQQRAFKIEPFMGGSGAEMLLRRYNDGWRWEPNQSCPDGSTCKRGDAFLRHDLYCYVGEQCGGNKCCLKCHHGNSTYGACDRACSKLQAKRKAKRDQEREAEAKATAKKQSKLQTEVRASCERIAKAADAAGLADDVVLPISRYGAHNLATIRKYANGDFEGVHLYSNDFAPDEIRDYPKCCEILNCSADYLAGLTDELHPTGACEAELLEEPDVLEEPDAEDEALKVRWEGRGVTPPIGSLILTCNLTNEGYIFRAAEWSGSEFHAPGKPKKVLTGLQFTRWLKVPLFDEECEYESTSLKLQNGLPTASGVYAAKFECEGFVMKKLAYYYSLTGKFYFDKSYGTSIEAECIGWIRLPEDF